MPPGYSLLVQTVAGVSWQQAPTHGKVPSLYVAIYADGVELQRTRTIKRELAPRWNHLSNISDGTSVISLRLFHDSALPFARDKCMGTVDTDIAVLVKLCATEDDPQAVTLELTGVGAEQGRPAGTISVRLMRDVTAAALAVEKSQKTVEDIGLSARASATVQAGEVVAQSVSAAADLVSPLAEIISKLELVVRIGDEIATIHPYANVAWKILTSVYQAAKKQQETDDKLIKLVETMTEVYSFGEDIDFLPQKIKSLEDKAWPSSNKQSNARYLSRNTPRTDFAAHRVMQNTWIHADRQIDELCETLLQLRQSFDGRLTVQSVFISTKVLEKVKSLEQSELLKKLNPVDMNATLRGSCLPGTRREILDDITGWVTVPSESGNILWLSGVAGSGKSTISTTISESFRALDRLGAFLFFDRNDRSHSHPGAVIRTIAHSLGVFNPHVGAAVSAVIQRDPAVVNAPIRTQFRELLLEPLQSAEPHIHGPVLIILDALDECGDRDSRDTLLSLLSTEFPKIPSLFRFLITSRRDPDIADHFSARFVEMDLDTGTSSCTEDVELFLRHEITQIRQRKKMSPSWPGEDNIRVLVRQASGLFIWASTATRFLNGYKPDERLRILLAQESSQGPARAFNLDGLYSVALRNSGPWDTDERFAQDARAVLACVVLGRVPMSADTIDVLLHPGQQTSEDVLKYLGCVVRWSPGKEARTLHASFADYLTDPDRSGAEPWALSPEADHHSLALGCLRTLHSELRFNICGLEDSHCRNVDVVDLDERVAKLISPPLSYASRFWFDHIQETPLDNVVLQGVDRFLRHQCLYWFEVLSLLGQIPVATRALGLTVRYVKGQHEDLEDFIADISRFIDVFAPAISQSAPHIYLSALPFAPRRSKIADQFGKWCPDTLRFQSAVGDGTRLASGSVDSTVRVWDVQTGTLALDALQGHTACVTSVCFSPDGARIASGSDDTTLRVWSAQSGTLVVGPFTGHTGAVTCVHFSPDGTQVVSGSRDHTVRVWNSRTGADVAEPFRGHTDSVASVYFSPNGAHIASGSWDGTVRVWGVQTGSIVVGPFKGHTGLVNCVQFSPSGALIASASDDKTVRIWDAHTGGLLIEPLQGHTAGVTSVNFSPDGARLASGSEDNSIRIWDAHTGVLVAGPLEGHTSPVTSVHFSPDDARIASGSYDSTVRVWDTQAGAAVDELFDGHTDWVTSVNFSPDGKRIASGSDTIRVWHAETGALVAGQFEAQAAGASSVHFSSDSARIASGWEDNALRVWDSQSGALVAGPFTGHTAGISSIQFSPDGTRIVSGSQDETPLVADLRSLLAAHAAHDLDSEIG
ncbi:WD40-repeat-containing domain protein [Mycena rosella]|uniref:WD40-repeat-containing domain protein n=1 Tax=Mycena rosella TaxID=1033263 RepID=A0AAD7GFP1_MYCRO|nr:WD40-repeat-containing domain protein [Mycena rosella]